MRMIMFGAVSLGLGKSRMYDIEKTGLLGSRRFLTARVRRG